MKRALAWVLLFGVAGASVRGQAPEQAAPNLVPNPGFEEYAIPPIGWFYRGVYFSKVMKFWTSPTAASPDIYGPRVRVPGHWSVQGFGEAEPHGGVSMVGLTLYGCEAGKPHCREYAQTLLDEPLRPGQAYELSFWVRPLPRGLRIDNIGVAFSRDEQRHLFDTLLAIPPTLRRNEIAATDGWQRLSWTFTARETADYLLIGNFAPDGQTRTAPAPSEPLPFAYYYVDDVELVKRPPFVEVPPEAPLAAGKELAPGDRVTLDKIYFDFDRDELLPRSFAQLNALYDLLRRMPGLSIQINGHTDSVGDPAYNLDLSDRRARAVVDHLAERGVDPSRLRHQGFGDTRPVADNASAEGRRANRRVEFEVLDL